MTKRVVTRKSSVRRSRTVSGEFPFTAQMVDDLSRQGPESSLYRDYRQQAWQTFSSLPMPSTRDEPWRRTDIRRLDSGEFRLPGENGVDGLPDVPSELLQPLVGDRHGGQIVMRPGKSPQVENDPTLASQGVIYSDLQTAASEHPQILADILKKAVAPEDGKFAALAGALAGHGILVYVPRGVHVEAPLHSVLWGPGAHLAHFSHLLIWVDEGGSLTYVHESASPEEEAGQILHGGLVEIHVGAGASLRFVELQSWGRQVWNFTHERAILDRDAQLDWIYGGLGTHLTKSFMDLDLTGQGANARMSGFFFADRNQHFDLDTQQNHKAPHTTSDLLYKGALAGQSRTVWQGMIYVAPGAQRTDGYQANRNLVLSSDARADSIPGLEIQADDVRCTHGATVGKMDPDLLFYLRSRGLPLPIASRLVVEGFFEPIMQRIPYEGVRARFQQAIVEKLGDENQFGT